MVQVRPLGLEILVHVCGWPIRVPETKHVANVVSGGRLKIIAVPAVAHRRPKWPRKHEEKQAHHHPAVGEFRKDGEKGLHASDECDIIQTVAVGIDAGFGEKPVMQLTILLDGDGKSFEHVIEHDAVGGEEKDVEEDTRCVLPAMNFQSWKPWQNCESRYQQTSERNSTRPPMASGTGRNEVK